jgi:hypothetical protein
LAGMAMHTVFTAEGERKEPVVARRRQGVCAQ